MILASVRGTITAPHKNKEFVGHKIMIVQPVNLQLEAEGKTFLAIDNAQAGIGDMVLVLKEGGGARMVLKNKNIAVQAVIVGIVDSVDIDYELIQS